MAQADSNADDSMISGINVTPLVNVVLVLARRTDGHGDLPCLAHHSGRSAEGRDG